MPASSQWGGSNEPQLEPRALIYSPRSHHVTLLRDTWQVALLMLEGKKMRLLIPGLVQHSWVTWVFIGQAGEDSKHDVTWSWRELGVAMDHHIRVSPSATVPC